MASKVWRWARRAWWLPAALTAAAWLVSVLISGAVLPLWLQILLITSGVLSSYFAFALPAKELITERKAAADILEVERRARADAVGTYKSKMHDTLIPMSLKVSEVVAATDDEARKDAQSSLRQMTVGYASASMGSEHSRACLYLLNGSTSPDRQLTLKEWHGRNRQPEGSFTEHTTRGRVLLEVVDKRDADKIDDVSDLKIADWKSEACGYCAVIFAAVFAGDTVFGILTVDSPVRGDFGPDDLDFLRLLAQLLATGLAAS